jgi:uncharacterized protein YkwD
MKNSPVRTIASIATGALLLTGAVTGVGVVTASPAEAQLMTIDRTDKASVTYAYKNWLLPARQVASGWTGGNVAGCVPGTISAAARTAALDAVNFYRTMAGLQTATENTTASANGQQAALMMAAQGDLNHYPGTSWACYTSVGATAAANSNLALGYTTSALAVDGYMNDDGQGNEAVGHRRWILFPPQSEFGFGHASNGDALVVGAPTTKTNTRPTGGTAWPSPGYFPYELLPYGNRWSYGEQGTNFTGKVVTVTKNGSTLASTPVITATNWGSSYSPDSAIVWQMPTLTEPPAGGEDLYQVTISGIAPFTVKVFRAATVELTPVSIQGTARAGNTLNAQGGTPTPSNATVYYQWNRDGSPIQGAVAQTYQVRPDDGGKSITLTVTATAQGYAMASATSPARAVEASPTISGTVTSTNGTNVSAYTVAYDNVECAGSHDDVTSPSDDYNLVGVPLGAGGAFSFPGYPGQCYKVYVRGGGGTVQTTLGSEYSVNHYIAMPTSGVNLVVGPPSSTIVSVTITGTLQTGATLSAVVVTIPAWASPSYQWLRNGVAITGATNETYVPVSADVGQPLSVRVTIAPAGYGSATLTSTAVAVVQGACAPNVLCKPMLRFTLGPDMSGDGRGEVLAVDTAGTLWLFPGTASGTLGTAVRMGTGFADQRIFGPGDINSDGRADLVTITAAGDLFLYPGKGGGQVAARTQIGNGWTGWRLIPAGDLTGDGRVDLLGIDSAGDLYMYAGKGNGLFGTKKKVGNGWNGWDLYSGADLTGDGKTDILGVNSAGNLFMYAGKGDGTFKTKVQVGNGWGAYTLAGGGDLNGSGGADIVGRDDATGDFFFYAGKGSGFFATKKLIATGW